MKKIGILTRDCAGINAAVRAVVRIAHVYNIETVGIFRGYDGLITGNLKVLDRRSVSGIINLGGTILKTARCEEFQTEQGQLKAVKTIKENNIDGLIVIGGNGSLSGAHLLAGKFAVPTIGIAATIDNDVNGIDLTLGADTAVNVALDALDKIRDTVNSLERIFVVEVMGRRSGWIALQVALSGGCEEVLLPEKDFDIARMCEEIKQGSSKGKLSWIIIVAEGKAKAGDIADKITQITGLETRIAVLGHIQRGGRPTRVDRIIAARLGKAAVELLKQGETDKCVGLGELKIVTVPLEEAIKPKNIDIDNYYKLIKILT